MTIYTFHSLYIHYRCTFWTTRIRNVRTMYVTGIESNVFYLNSCGLVSLLLTNSKLKTLRPTKILLILGILG